MDLRRKELLDLQSFTQTVETEVTMLLQSLQWDPKRILQGSPAVTCQYDDNHRMPKDCLESHERICFLSSMGYMHHDELLPDPPDVAAHTLVKLGRNEIQQIINEASKMDPMFKKGVGPPPLSLAGLQRAYSADERRALYDAVVAAVPSCHDLGDLALVSSSEDAQAGGVSKSRVDILAELRNMKRRRTKYRVAPKTRNYSHVLRDVIKTQMESYTEAVSNTSIKVEVCELTQGNDYFQSSAMTRDTNQRRDSVSTKRHDRDSTMRDNCRESSRYKEDRYKKDASKRYEDRYDRSDSRKSNLSHRDNYQRRPYRGDTTSEKYRNGSKSHTKRYKTRGEEYTDRYSSNKERKDRHDYDDRDIRRRHEEEKYRKAKSKENKRKSYDLDDQNDSNYYKVKKEPDDGSEISNQYSYQSDSNRNRSSSRERDSHKRKHREGRKRGGDEDYTRYYDVKQEKF